ncbi:MarR family winged helix-turn-helix transcriptional regulator [Demequina zhanjiangensis]|uniref:MarR family transcriptional regulator n=1 Tax=Demequina zhanjiangensis TaxID=3051659 RepID=A0ABT8G0Y0_9MICO|nr:MarR family transcriptional regulator [Demequina sp. SYSU T00b26]MDN4472800.1 MarR family transcriptional regulator [Demequina sp. SYSU T00b26]
MTGTDVPDEIRESLETVDGAVMSLRRFASSARPDQTAGGDRLEMSTVLVVDAVSRHGGRATVGAVATELHVVSTTATRLVDRAETAGMVTREASPDDGRRVEVLLTRRGRELDAQALDFRVERLSTLLADWDPARIARFAADLAQFAEAAEAQQRERGTR